MNLPAMTLPAMTRLGLLAAALALGLTASALAQTADSGIDPVPVPTSGDGPAPDIARAPSFQRSSGQGAGGPANELNTGDARSADDRPAEAVAALAAVATGRDLYHGNYCGPGDHGAGMPAIDALDEACRRHDACYDAAGLPDCACDGVLKRDAMLLAEDRALSRTLRARAASVAESTALMRCRRRDG